MLACAYTQNLSCSSTQCPPPLLPKHPLQDKAADSATQRMLFLDDDALRAIAADDMELSGDKGGEGAARGSQPIHGQTRTEDGSSDAQIGGLGVRGGLEGPHSVNWLREQLLG